MSDEAKHEKVFGGLEFPAKRRFPYPFRAMMAVCSDLDETPDQRVYREIVRYLNSAESTSMGAGVNLEIGNTIYFDMPPDQFAYWNTDDAGRAMVRALIQSGHIDCLHSFGDLATTRGSAGRALEELDRYSCKVEVWVDHGTAVSNFGGDIMRGFGDVPGSEVFHADLTWDYGVRHVWRGRVSSMLGQDGHLHFGGIFNKRFPLQSSRTLAKEAAKAVLGKCGNVQYEMHAANRLSRPARLRSGQEILEFMRCNPFWGGVGKGATADGIAEVLTQRFLQKLVSRNAPAILYTHLGKVRDAAVPFSKHTCAALRGLADKAECGEILVTTTRRLLQYEVSHERVVAERHTLGEWEVLNINSGNRGGELDGQTWYVRDANRTQVLVNGIERPDLLRNKKDESGRESVSFPWKKLELPQVW